MPPRLGCKGKFDKVVELSTAVFVGESGRSLTWSQIDQVLWVASSFRLYLSNVQDQRHFQKIGFHHRLPLEKPS